MSLQELVWHMKLGGGGRCEPSKAPCDLHENALKHTPTKGNTYLPTSSFTPTSKPAMLWGIGE